MKKIASVLVLLLILATGISAKEKNNFRLSSASVTPRVLNYIKQNYIDQNRVNAAEMLKGALSQIQKSAAEILVTFEDGNKFTITIDKATKKFQPKELATPADLWSILKEVYTFIEMHYHGTIEQQEIEYAAIDGILETLDPHSNLLTPKIFNEFKIGTKGKFGGIGIVIGSKDGNLTVISPIEGTPAWRAGVKAKDKITKIGEESTINMSLTEAVELLRGDVGTDVTLTIERAGRSAPFTVSLKRAVINIESIQSAPIEADGRTVGYIKIKNFQEDTDKDFSKQLTKLKESANFSGLILDLRNNPGGLLSQAVEIADKFLSEGVIVSTVGAGNDYLEQESAKAPGTEPSYPIIVLVNEGSASASEIVSGTLQSYGRAILVGTQTFGKGSVQTVYDMQDGSGLKLTIAEYLTAGKNSIQSVGVTPDIKLVPAIVDLKKMDISENEFEKEASLEKHLDRSQNTAKNAAYTLSYYMPPEEDNEDERSRREYSSRLDLSKDAIVQFAAKVLANAPTDAHQSLLKSAQPQIGEFQKEQQALIAKAMEKIGIDWKKCTPGAKPVLQVSFSLQKNGAAVQTATAGEEVDLVLNAKNIGGGPFCHLVGISTSKDDLMKNREFVIGNLAPGTSRKASAPLKIPASLISQNMPFTVKFSEEGSNQPKEFQAILPIKGLAQPLYSFFYKIGVPENTKVAGAPMPEGKKIPLTIEVKNIGKGTSINTVVAVKNTESKGVFLDAGRANLGKLEPGAVKTATLKFHIEPSFSKNTFELELTIIDQETFAAISKKIEFTVATGVADPPAERWYQPPIITLSGMNFPASTNSAKFHIEGEIQDDNIVKDYFIFVGENKVAYSSNVDTSPKFAISADLPLKEGPNHVTIIARDDFDLISRYSFVVDRR